MFKGCRPGVSNHRNDAAARGKDLKVFSAFDLEFEFVETVAGEYDVSVRIDKSGANNVTCRVYDLLCLPFSLDLLPRSDRNKLSVFDGDCTILDDAEVGSPFLARLRCTMADGSRPS